MAVEEAPRLLPTLQTVLGMVRHNGLPCRRALPDGKTSVADANEAAIRDPSVTLYELKRYMRSRRRLDLEQAVAMVLSLLPDEDTRVKLARLVGPDMLRGSCMWRVAPEDYQTPTAPFEAALESYKGKVQRIMSKYTPADASSTDDRELALLMLRVRRHRPGLGNSQRLRLPQMLLQHLPDLDARDRHIWSLRDSDAAPSECELNDPSRRLVVGKQDFKVISRWLGRMDGDPSDAAVLNRDVAAAERELLHDVRAALASSDVLSVAFSFLALQRRLQLKVVSGLVGGVFLKKNEGRHVQQNSPHVLTSFELALASLAAAAPDPDWGALTAVAVPPCVPPEHAAAAATPADLEHQLTTVCMLGMRYVNLHGQGLFANLAGKKARGPVDTYNLICDLVSELRRRSRRQRGAAATDAAAATSPSSPCGTATPSDKAAAGDSGSGGGQAASAEATTGDSSSLARGCGLEIIGPCHKFLAVDIMFCNRSFDDDAFAGGKVPGWFYFLRDRQKLEGPLSDFAAPPRAAAAAASNNDDQESSAH